MRCGTLMGAARWGQVYFDNKALLEWWTSSPVNKQHAEMLEEKEVPHGSEKMFQASSCITGGISTVQSKCSEIFDLARTCPAINIVGPPGTGKTTHIQGMLRVMFSDAARHRQNDGLKVLVLGPTNHNVYNLGNVAEKVLKEKDNRSVGAWLLQSEAAAKKKRNPTASFSHVAIASLQGSTAEPLMRSLAQKGNVIVCCTTGLLQKPIREWNDCLIPFLNTFDVILVDEGSQIVEVHCFVLQTFLRRCGRIFVFGDAKQLS